MNRTYDQAWYKNKIDRIYELVPDCAISSDVIAGFCSETDADHQETLNIMRYAKYSMSYMFMYSERPGTPAAKKYADDVPKEIKKIRLQEVISLQNELSIQHNRKDVGKSFEILIEGDSKRSSEYFKGRNSQNKMVVFPKTPRLQPGDYTIVTIKDATSATLIGVVADQPVEVPLPQ